MSAGTVSADDDKAGEDGVLLALKPRWAKLIVTGAKTAEVRRRRMHVAPGAICLLYATAPISAVVGTAIIDAVHGGDVADLWRRFGPASRLSHAGFVSYLRDAKPTILELGFARRIEPVGLEIPAPQSWLRLRRQDPRHQRLLDQVAQASI